MTGLANIKALLTYDMKNGHEMADGEWPAISDLLEKDTNYGGVKEHIVWGYLSLIHISEPTRPY